MSLFLSESGLDVVMLDGGAFTVSVLWPRSIRKFKMWSDELN